MVDSKSDDVEKKNVTKLKNAKVDNAKSLKPKEKGSIKENDSPDSETNVTQTENNENTVDAEKVDNKLNEYQQQAEDFKKKYFYQLAEMENMKKRFEREKSNLIKFGNEKVICSLLDVLDNLERTLGVLENEKDEKIKNLHDGIEMIRKQFFEILNNNGLARLECLGKIFDPQFHEALSMQEVEGKKEQEIIQVFQNGYLLNDRLIRPAKVIVAKGK